MELTRTRRLVSLAAVSGGGAMGKKVDRPSVRDGYDLWSETYDATPNPLVALDRRYTIGLLRPQPSERIVSGRSGALTGLGLCDQLPDALAAERQIPKHDAERLKGVGDGVSERTGRHARRALALALRSERRVWRLHVVLEYLDRGH